MIITLPFKYDVRGVEPRKRNDISKPNYDNVSVHIHDVDRSDLTHALTLVDRAGRHLETFYHFNNAFWIENSRASSQPFLNQHLMLAGQWPRTARPPLKRYASPRERQNYRAYSQDDADHDNSRYAAALDRIGILARHTTRPWMDRLIGADGNLTAPFRDAEGTVICDVTDPSEGFRMVMGNDREKTAEKMSSYAQDNVIAVDGKLFHKVPPPVIYATDDKVDWCFSESLYYLSPGSIHDESTYDYSSAHAYRMPMTDEGVIADAFPEHAAADKVMFKVHYIDEQLFEPVDLSKGVIKDIETVMSVRFDLAEKPTDFITRWCEVRDLVSHVLYALDEQSEDFYDSAASILCRMEEEGLGKFPGATMWNNRAVALTLNPATTIDKESYR